MIYELGFTPTLSKCALSQVLLRLPDSLILLRSLLPFPPSGEYQIYENKPGIDQDALQSTACLDLRVQLAGKELLLDGKWHDPPHYLKRKVS